MLVRANKQKEQNFNIWYTLNTMFKQQRTAGQGLSRTDKVKQEAKTFGKRFMPWLSVIMLAVLVLGPLGLFIWLFTSTNTFVVQAVTVVDARAHTEEAIKSFINEELATSKFSDNIFLVPTEALEFRLKQNLPQLRTVRITRQLPGTIKIIAQEKQASLLFLSGGKYYLVDENGEAYEEARLEILPETVLPVVKNSSNKEIQLGVSTVTPDLVKLLQELHEELPEITGAEVAEVRIPAVAARELEFKMTNNWDLLFDAQRTAGSQLSILRRVLNEIIGEQEQANLEYIDLRIPQKIYYKLTATAVGTP